MRKSISIPKWYENNRLKYLRKKKDITQTQVANNIECVLKTYQNYEQGHTFPTLEYATKLADLYNVSIDYLLGKSDYECYKTVAIPQERYDRMVESYDKALKELEELRKELEQFKKGGAC